ncbi:EcsC family protein [Blastococcus jejuensis]|uniref:EcsC family protein n=1 Tax=Blastococcus jejuensis TaxID=351224 RepID=A0ABP6NVP2_9ACTN
MGTAEIETVLEDGAQASLGEDEKRTVAKFVDKIVEAGIDGVGPLESARNIAEQHRLQHADVEVAIDRLIATHTRLVAATGFATGLGGVFALPVTIPTDAAVLYTLSARCVAAVAHLRGYDIESDEVRSVVLLTLLGAGGAAVAAEAGVQLGSKAALAALQRVPGRVLIEINKKVGFRLFTKFGTKGVVNLGKMVPLVGGGVGAGINAAAMRSAGKYSKRNFPKA